MWYYNGQIIKTPKPMVISDVTYPAAIFRDAATLEALGILPYRVDNTINQRYYWTGETTVAEVSGEMVATVTGTEKDVDSLKISMISKVRSSVSSKLAQTDWMVIRAYEGGTEMTTEMSTYRTSLRAESNTKETEINALTTLAEVIDYENRSFTEVRYVKHTAEDGTETYGPETTSHTREIDMCTHFDSVDPEAEVDPAFVSLTED